MSETQKIFCLQCQQLREIQNPREIVLENDRPALEGTCAICHSPLLKILYRNACQ